MDSDSINCAICNKKLSFWNQPIFGKGDLKLGEKICSSCFLKINNKSPRTAAHLKNVTLSDVVSILGLKSNSPDLKETLNDNHIERTNPDAGSHLSTKLLRILKSKTNLSDKELDEITETEGWSIVYSLNTPKEKLTEICFTGFMPSEKENLIEIAIQNNFNVVKSVTKNLSFLCIGDDPGPSKMEKAESQNVHIIKKEEFLNLIKTGEIPNNNLR